MALGEIHGVIERMEAKAAEVELLPGVDGPVLGGVIAVAEPPQTFHLDPGGFAFKRVPPGCYFVRVREAYGHLDMNRWVMVVADQTSKLAIRAFGGCEEGTTARAEDTEIAEAVGIAVRLSIRQSPLNRVYGEDVRAAWLTNLPRSVQPATVGDLQRTMHRQGRAWFLSLTVRPGDGCVFVSTAFASRHVYEGKIVHFLRGHEDYVFRGNGTGWEFDVAHNKLVD